MIEHECTGDEELLVKNLGIKNYKAAAVGVTKFSPLHDKVLEDIGKEIKRELKNYSKDPTNTYKYRGELEKLADFRNDPIEMREFLPTPEVQEAIASDLTSIIPRVILKYLKPYSKFKGASI